MISTKNLFQVYCAKSNIFGIVSTDYEQYNSLIKSLIRSLEGLRRIRMLYPRLLNEHALWTITDALMTLVHKPAIDWIAYTIYDSETNIVIQEWRYEIQDSSGYSIDIPSTKLLPEIPFISLADIPSSAIFICHVFGNSSLSEKKGNLLEPNPINISAYPNDIWWHSQTYSQSSYRIIAQDNLSVINPVSWVNTEWEPVAKFPGKCIKGEEYKLELVFRPKQVNHSTISTEVPLQLLVVVTGQDFDIISDYYHNIEINVEQESEKIIFQLSPKSNAVWGEKEVIIDFFSKGRRIGNLVIKTKISNPTHEEQEDIVGSPISREIFNRAASSSLKTVTLSAATIRNTNDVRYDIFSSNFDGQIGIKKAVDENDIKKFVNKFEQETSTFIKCSNPEYYQNTLMKIKSIGNKLYDLFPQEFQNYFFSLEEGTIIQIYKVEELQWIPWEIIFDRKKDKFWSESFIITRLPKNGKKNDTSNNYGLSDKIDFFTKMFHFVSTDISIETDRINRAKKFINAILHHDDYTCEVNSSSANLQQKLTQLSKVSILHFTCHCIKDGNRPILALSHTSKAMNEGLDVDMIPILNLNNVTFIFSNTCSSETYIDWWGESINFGFACLDKGVQIYIGTIGVIPVRFALEFAEFFYEKLIVEQFSFGEAIWMTKQQFKSSNNPFWLYYCLYGDAGLRLRYKPSDNIELPENQISNY